MRPLRPLAAGALLLAGLLGVPSASPATTPVRAVPTTFGFGVQAGTDTTGLGGWTQRSGVPWGYAYRYLGGGVTSGHNWTTLAPQATYPRTYAQTAAAQGMVPVFTYYQLLATGAPCSGCSEPRRDLQHLSEAATMRAYFGDFALLMKRLGPGTWDGVSGYGRDAVVHVEPDLSGFTENAVLGRTSCYSHCTGIGNSPRLLRAAVASSGFAQALRYPDTYQGFNQVLLHLRDLYAPNVRLALHVSNWATGYDLNSATSPALDATALGRQAAAYASASGARRVDAGTSTYDLLFNDVSNKDAAYYTYVLHKPRFWDQDNTTFPNFHRWEAYLREVTRDTGLKAVVWQVPVGNQVFRSENNTAGHWQDNRVQYLFDHVRELRDAGLVGALFGTTLSSATSFADRSGDGVTNPRPVCTHDGRSSATLMCSSRTATVSDDDGGYLRLRGRAYYAAPLPLG
ncbi:MAG: hypothetical protein ACXVFV_02910 [Mycobacteriales bacterium]